MEESYRAPSSDRVVVVGFGAGRLAAPEQQRPPPPPPPPSSSLPMKKDGKRIASHRQIRGWCKCLAILIFPIYVRNLIATIVLAFPPPPSSASPAVAHSTSSRAGANDTDVGSAMGRPFNQLQPPPSRTDVIAPHPAEGRPLPFSFSACLLIKDGNIILPEWLAYHYTFLPLRRLIVGVDPLSLTDPKPILDLYESIGMNVTTWVDDSFWVDGRAPHEKKVFRITNETGHEPVRWRHNYRQNLFYKACFQQLHDEMRTWTLLIDTDEYLAFNHYEEHEGEPSWCKKNISCAEEYTKSIKDGTHLRTKLDRAPSATAAEHIDRQIDEQFDNPDKPCVIFSRYLFVSKESNMEEIQREVGRDFNATFFHTMRYRYRTPLSKMELGKSMIDVSRYDGRDITNVHRPLGDMCTGYNAWAHNAMMSFRVHHYIGSYETFRRPGFDTRSSFFNKRNNQKDLVVDTTTPRYSPEDKSTWLTQFATLVGREKAVNLTQQSRIWAELEMDKVMMELANGPQAIDWDLLNKKPGT